VAVNILKKDMVRLFEPEEVGPITSKYALVVVSVGKHSDDCLEITGPRFEDYAEKYDMDFVLLTGDKCPVIPMFNKFRIHNVLDHYEGIFYLDTDIILSRNAPDIRSSYPMDKVLFYDELNDCLFGKGHPGWANAEALEISFSQTRVQTGIRFMANGGVLYIPRKLRRFYAPPEHDIPMYQCTDQLLLTTRIWPHTNNYAFLDYKWNCEQVSPFFWERFPEAYCIHANALLGYSRLNFLKHMDKHVI
jgi:hypothetical protein